jgi:hypothetical protein
MQMYVNHIKTEIDEIKKELKTLPDGHLVQQKTFYYQMIGKVQKGITKDNPRIRQLARKAYLTRRLKHLEMNYSLLTGLSWRYMPEDPVQIIRLLPSVYQTLHVSYFLPLKAQDPYCNETFIKKAVENDFHPERLVFITNSGIRVRSKSERTIADLLDQNKIPFRYEAELLIGNRVRRPDFSINRFSDGKLVIWEHFGLMDQEEYRQKTIDKLHFYLRHSFFPSDNLICTYEHDLRDIVCLQKLIEIYLLGR